MPDFRELFTSPDFEAYQDIMVDVIVDRLREAITQGNSPIEIMATMNLARKILVIPQGLEARQDVSKRLEAAVKARLIAIPAKLMRREMFNE